MKKIIFTIALCLISISALGGVLVKTSEKIGPIKVMNAVNNGPQIGNPHDQTSTNFFDYKAARFPYARTHDSPGFWDHTVDINHIFPDFDADENDPKSYDFKLTDRYLKGIIDAGTQVFFRLGQTIENDPVKYYVFPPKDYKKWARICEHIIRHYNEGWNEGFHWDIKYWEIWNEADLGHADGRWKENMSPMWNGSDQQFFEFHKVVTKHLKSKFPDIKVGGPASSGDEEWCARFVAYMAKHKVPLDFFSWHRYAYRTKDIDDMQFRMRKLLDDNGFNETESILNEWNYIIGWNQDYEVSLKEIKSEIGAAFTASVMQVCQDGPTDMLMYYDARPRTVFNGLFDHRTQHPLPPYYALYAWSHLAELGTQVKVESTEEDIYVTSACGDTGRTGTLITYFSHDRNKVTPKKFVLKLQDCKISESVSHLTDFAHLYTERPIEFINGEAEVWLHPNSFIYIETRP